MSESNKLAQVMLETARQQIEREEFIRAVQGLILAFDLFIAEQDYSGVVQSLADQTNAWRHRYNYSKAHWDDAGEAAYLTHCQQSADLMFEMYRQHKVLDQICLVWYRAAVPSMLKGKWEEAAKMIKIALDNLPSDFSKAQRGDWMVHYGEALFKNGKREEGLTQMLAGLQLLEYKVVAGTDLDAFLVWQSGAYMKLADAGHESGDMGLRRMYLNTAFAIVNRNPNLLIRRHELEFLLQKFGVSDKLQL